MKASIKGSDKLGGATLQWILDSHRFAAFSPDDDNFPLRSLSTGVDSLCRGNELLGTKSESAS